MMKLAVMRRPGATCVVCADAVPVGEVAWLAGTICDIVDGPPRPKLVVFCVPHGEVLVNLDFYEHVSTEGEGPCEPQL